MQEQHVWWRDSGSPVIVEPHLYFCSVVTYAKFLYFLFTEVGANACLQWRNACRVAGSWLDVLMHPLLYILLSQGQRQVAVLIGFREQRRECRLQTDVISSTRHKDELQDSRPTAQTCKRPKPPSKSRTPENNINFCASLWFIGGLQLFCWVIILIIWLPIWLFCISSCSVPLCCCLKCIY